MKSSASLFVLSVEVLIFVNSAPVDEKLLKPGSVEMRDTSDHPIAHFSNLQSGDQQNNPVPLVITRLFTKARDRGFCLRRLSSLG